MKKIFLITTIMLAGSMIIYGQAYSGKNQRSQADKLNEAYCTGLFKSADGTILNLLDENTSVAGYLNILDWLQGRVAGLQVYTLRNGIKIPYIRGSRASIYLDEIPVDAAFLNAFSVYDIAMVKVIKGPFAGSFGNNSTVAIYTIQPEEDEEELLED